MWFIICLTTLAIGISLMMRFANCATQAQHTDRVLPELVQHGQSCYLKRVLSSCHSVVAHIVAAVVTGNC